MLDNLLNNFTLLSKIGEGSFSEVLKVKNKGNGKFYAAKRLTKFYQSTSEAMNCSELKTLQKLEYHPNVLSLVDFVWEEMNGSLILIFDLMDMSLYDFIKNRKKTLSETRCKCYLYQLAQGLHHLHRSGIFHRDIKPENILVRSDSRLRCHNSELVQLADLGSVCHSDFPQPHSAYISTRWYRSPECLLTSGFYGPKMDVWALGCVFYEILTLQPLFPGDNELDQLHKIHEVIGSPSQKLLERFKHCNVSYDFPKKKPLGFHNFIPMLSEYGVDILKKTLVYHPDSRYSAKKLLEHIYFEDLKKNRNSSGTSRMLLTSSMDNLDFTIPIFNKKSGTKSSLSSRGSSNSTSSRGNTKEKLLEVQQNLNKQLERGWGMNQCPKKTRVMSSIKSSVAQRRRSIES